MISLKKQKQLLTIIFLTYKKNNIHILHHYKNKNITGGVCNKKIYKIHIQLMSLLTIFYIKYIKLKKNKKNKKEYFSPSFNLKIFLISLWGGTNILNIEEKRETISYNKFFNYIYNYYVYTMSQIINYYY